MCGAVYDREAPFTRGQVTCLIAPGEPTDEVVRVGIGGSLYHTFYWTVLQTIGYVLQDRMGKQDRFLTHQCYLENNDTRGFSQNPHELDGSAGRGGSRCPHLGM